MNEQIKQRITQLNKGEVPNGYKKTEFGVFPCDWVTNKKLKDLGAFGKGKGLPGNKMVSEGVPCVGYGDIYMKYNHFHFEEAKTFVDEKTATESQPIQKGTLLFTGTGETAEEIGKCVCYNGEETIYAGGDIITFVSDEVDPLFLAYQQYQDFSLRKKASFGQGHSVVHIQRDNLEKLNVAFPQSAEEQSKIAEILMKWDEVIELLEQYIAALENRKKFLMKKLLTPQKDWDYVLLGDICEIKTGRLDANAMEEDGVYPFFTCSKDVYRINQYSFDCEALLMAGNGDIGDVKYYKGKFDAYQRTYVLSKFTFNIHYVMQYLLLNFDRDVMRGMQKSSMPYIKLDLLNKAKIYYNPSAVESTVRNLSIVDKEIEFYIKNLEQTKKQRKTLQQYLLNGIVRVQFQNHKQGE